MTKQLKKLGMWVIWINEEAFNYEFPDVGQDSDITVFINEEDSAEEVKIKVSEAIKVYDQAT